MPLRTIIIVKAALFTVATSSAPARNPTTTVTEILRLIQSRPASPLRELELPEPPLVKAESETENADANGEN